MKFLSTSTILLISAVIIPAFAAPLPVDVELVDLEGRAVSATAQKAIAWIKDPKNNAKVNAKPVCFYSGFTDVMNPKLKKAIQVTAQGQLNAFMGQRGCQNIDNVVDAAGSSKDKGKWSGDDWLEVSRALAQNVKGTVPVLLGQTVPSSSVWVKAEKPALVGNKAVTHVEQYLLEAAGKFTKKANIK